MWKLLYRLASPRSFYRIIDRFKSILLLASVFILISGLVWGLVFSPADYQQGDAFRIIYIHVPCAFSSMAIYAWMGFLAFLLLVWRIKIAGMLLHQMAQIGLFMTLLALITGSVWGKPMWGAWWIWDARLTSELILFLLYAAILAMYHSTRNKEHADKIIAILILVGLVDLPIIHYSVNWWHTLHQGSTLSVLAKPKIAASMLYPLLLCIGGSFMYCGWIILEKSRQELLIREKKQAWVKDLFEGEL